MTTASDPPALPPDNPGALPSRIGAYRVVRLLGEGGMGRVYEAEAAGTRVALKVLHPHLASAPGARERFLREGALGLTVRHENVVRTLECASADEGDRHLDFLVMELVEGQTLHALRAELGTLPEELCRHVAREVGRGLAAIHAAGIVHRDIKPENVLLTGSNVVKIMDLGVARPGGDAARVTQSGMFVGSVRHAAPEQFASSGSLDGRADLYSLGVVLYELLAGSCPFEDPDWRVLVGRVMHEPPPRLGTVNPQVSPFLEELVHVLLAKDREQRIPSASRLLEILELGESSPWWTSRAQSLRATTHRPLRRMAIPRETPLVGRETELGVLRTAYRNAKSGQGQVILIEGEAGIGKSRLVDELVARLQHEGEDLDFLHGSYAPGSLATGAGAFVSAYLEHFGDSDLDAALTQALADSAPLVPGFAALLAGRALPEGALPLTQAAVHSCFIAATRAIAAERVAVVAIDDLHFASEEGRRLFAALALSVPGHRILLIGTSRPPIDETWAALVAGAGCTTRLPVGRLGIGDLTSLLSGALQSPRAAEALSARIAESSGGNPFFVFELLRSLKDGAALGLDPGDPRTTGEIRELRLPSSIADMLEARLASLPEADLGVLEIAACMGSEFDPNVVADVAGVPRLPLLRALGRIERQHRLIRAAGRRFAFDHHQVQEHLRARQPGVRRRQHHAAIAESLERARAASGAAPPSAAACVELCEHFLEGGQARRALPYLQPAVTHLLQGCLHAPAARVLERALATDVPLGDAERSSLLRQQAAALAGLGRRAQEEEAAREAARLAEAQGRDDLLGQAMVALGYVLLHTARLAESATSFRRAADAARACGDRTLEASAEMGLGNALRGQGRLAESREHAERALALSRETGHLATEATASVNLGHAARFEGRLAEAREHLERALEICRATGRRTEEAIASGTIGDILCGIGRLGEARDYMHRALAIHRDTRHRPGEASVLCGLGSLEMEAGDHEAARDHLLASRAIAREVGSHVLVACTALNMAEMLLDAGRDAEAWEWATKACDEAQAHGLARLHAWARCQLAARSPEDLREARAQFEAQAALMHGEERRGAAWRLWKATRDPAHLEDVRRLLEQSLSQLSPEDRASARAGLSLHRAVAAESATPEREDEAG